MKHVDFFFQAASMTKKLFCYVLFFVKNVLGLMFNLYLGECVLYYFIPATVVCKPNK
jgi:hypothetical protein